jgi:tetratricopeptide (TPR) repeat protein
VTIAGVVVGGLLVPSSSPAISTGSERIASGGGFTARTEMWRVSADAVRERPLLGRGPGSFQAATTPIRTLEFVDAEGEGRYFFDAHNLIVEYAVTTGLVGALLLLAWLALELLRLDIRSPLAGFALVTLVIHLVQPQTAVITPLAMLALGAAGASRDVRASQPHARAPLGLGLATAASAVLGVVLAASVAAGFWFLDQARLDFEDAKAHAADRLLPDAWWQAKEQRARVLILRAREANAPEFPTAALQLRRHAAADAASDPRPLLALADTYLQLGRQEEANRTLDEVLRVDPWSVPALNARARGHLASNEPGDAKTLLERSIRVKAAQPAVVALLEDLSD